MPEQTSSTRPPAPDGSRRRGIDATQRGHIAPRAAPAPAQPAQRSAIAQFHLQRIRLHVLAHLDDNELCVAKVARTLELSPSHVHRLFADEAQTFSVWMWETRLQACHLALREPAYADVSISQLAFRHGYVHAAHFSRVYRARFGMTARQWRAAPLPLAASQR